ncbi:MAG TPA: HAD-IIA family hydrolase [bacterium]|nr:HAD-IIA family hydrolase [bacterium]
MQKSIKACIIDIDGVLYEGKVAVPGAKETLAYLVQKRIPFVLLTNTTMRSRQGMSDKVFERVGVRVPAEQILTASSLTADYLRKQGSPPSFILLAENGMQEFTDIPYDDADPTYVAVGDLGRGFNFDVLNKAFRALWNGAELIAMQNEPYELGDNGPELNVGSWVALLERASGKQATVIAKPSKQAFLLALDHLGTQAEETAMIGDTIAVDIWGAQQVGLQTILVRTGKSDFASIHGIEPDLQLASIRDLPTVV